MTNAWKDGRKVLADGRVLWTERDGILWFGGVGRVNIGFKIPCLTEKGARYEAELAAQTTRKRATGAGR